MTIFASVNEKGEVAWQLVLNGRKAVTRRVKPMTVGTEFAVQPGRGKKAVCRARVISCMAHEDWVHQPEIVNSTWRAIQESMLSGIYKQSPLVEEEAHCEGFESWAGLLAWFDKKGIDINKTWRIQFEVVSL